VVRIDLNRPMAEIRAELTRYPVKTRLALSGPMVVARDIAHARSRNASMPAKRCPLTCGNAASTTQGRPRRRPVTPRAHSVRPPPGRMDSYVRSSRRLRVAGHVGQGESIGVVTDSCQANGGSTRIDRRSGRPPGPGLHPPGRVLEYPELGMEAVWNIEVEDFPAFIVVDDKGNDFFAETSKPVLLRTGSN